MHDAIAYIHDAADALQAERAPSDELGRLTDEAVAIMRASGGMRLMQACSHGGAEADPRVFFEWTRAVGRYNPAAGWVAGVVGVHPYEVALADPKLQEEIFTDPETWIASPYAPMGRATRRDDGFVLTGKWQYSTGTDHSDWVVLGGLVIDGDTGSGPPDFRHFFLPRSDYEIIEDSWHVMGLEGTGSKEVHVDGSFVPEYRTMSHNELADGAYGSRRADSAVFQLPFGCMFSAAIASATFGIAEGTLAAYREYMASRVSAMGVVGATDPFQQQALAEAEADLAAGVTHVDAMIGEWLDRIARGEAITPSDRLEFRRNQTRAVQRVITAIDVLMTRAGSAAVWTTNPIEKYWRDLRTAGTHVCNGVDTVYTSWADDAFETGNPIRTFH